MRLRVFIFCIVIFASASTIKAQDRAFSRIDLKYHHGKIIPHTKEIKHLVDEPTRSFNINICKQTIGDKFWQQLYRYPCLGFGYHFVDVGNDDTLGAIHALYSYLKFPIVRTQNFSLNYQVSTGLAYATAIWDSIENPSNYAISTHNNLYLNVNLEAKVRLYKQVSLISGVGMTHHSNGSYRKPNKGLNYYDVNVGLSYDFNDNSCEYRPRNIEKYTASQNQLDVVCAAGLREIYPVGGSRYFASTFSVGFAHQFNHRQKYGLGVDLFYDESLYAYFEEGEDILVKDIIRQSVFVSHELLISKFSFITQLGIYTYHKAELDRKFYTRVGIRYNFWSNVFANLSLKAYYAKAEVVEWGVGYSFK